MHRKSEHNSVACPTFERTRMMTTRTDCHGDLVDCLIETHMHLVAIRTGNRHMIGNIGQVMGIDDRSLIVNQNFKIGRTCSQLFLIVA